MSNVVQFPTPTKTLEYANNLDEVGFKIGEVDQLIAEKCRVTFYPTASGWRVDIELPNENAVDFEVPYRAVEMMAWQTKKPKGVR